MVGNYPFPNRYFSSIPSPRYHHTGTNITQNLYQLSPGSLNLPWTLTFCKRPPQPRLQGGTRTKSACSNPAAATETLCSPPSFTAMQVERAALGDLASSPHQPQEFSWFCRGLEPPQESWYTFLFGSDSLIKPPALYMSQMCLSVCTWDTWKVDTQKITNLICKI